MSRFSKTVAALRTAALAYPEAYEDFPWGESAFKVGPKGKGKVFCFLSEHKEGQLTFTVKLPSSSMIAKELPGVTATGYGLGKSGWITLTLTAADKPDLSLMRDWLDESFRSVAPKAVLKKISG
jgi:predicted DNA-binding protein (MmcQ/YjbR family)